MKFIPHEYQKIAINKIYETKRAGLFLDMGLGKTVITLTAVEDLIYNQFEVDRVLVIAPLRVAEDTWSRESDKWEHLKHLKISKILGNKEQRLKALSEDSDIYIINRENVVWLVNELSGIGDAWNFDMVVIDELSSFKSAKAQRFRMLKKYISKSRRVVGLTGTPSPNGLIDLWSEIYLIDGGMRLGKTLSSYREKYFLPDKRNQITVFNYKPKDGAEKLIKDSISDICISMKAEDLLNMPKKVETVKAVKLSKREMSQYLKFEKESYMQFLEGEATATSAAALTNKLLQYSNGAVYLTDGSYASIHSKKLDMLDEIIEAALGKPILCFYSYKHDLAKIQERFKYAVKLKSTKDIEEWNKGDIPLLLAHPASAGHGLNLQDGGNTIVWYGLTWSLELYLQANARIYRQGQTNTVFIHHIVTEDTADERVLTSLQMKEDVQEGLLQALKVKFHKNKKSNTAS